MTQRGESMKKENTYRSRVAIMVVVFMFIFAATITSFTFPVVTGFYVIGPSNIEIKSTQQEIFYTIGSDGGSSGGIGYFNQSIFPVSAVTPSRLFTLPGGSSDPSTDPEDYNWTVTGSNSVTIGLNTGCLNVDANPEPAVITIRATSKTNTRQFAESEVTIGEERFTLSEDFLISIPSTIEVDGADEQLTIHSFFSLNSNHDRDDLIWSIENNGDVSITQDGIVTVNSNATGSFILKAYIFGEPDNMCQGTVQIINMSPSTVQINGDMEIYATIGTEPVSYSYDAMSVSGAEISDGFEWYISGYSYANIDENGVVTLDDDANTGEMVIGVKYSKDPSYFFERTIFVRYLDPDETNILAVDEVYLNDDDIQEQVTFTAFDINGKDVSDGLQWCMVDPTQGMITSSGSLTIYKENHRGNFTIGLKDADNQVVATHEIALKYLEPSSLDISGDSELILSITDQHKAYSVIAYDMHGRDISDGFYLAIDDESRGSFNDNGLLTLYGSNNQANLSVSAYGKDDDINYGQMTIEMKLGVPGEITIDVPQDIELSTDDLSIQLSFAALSEEGIDLNDYFEWYMEAKEGVSLSTDGVLSILTESSYGEFNVGVRYVNDAVYYSEGSITISYLEPENYQILGRNELKLYPGDVIVEDYTYEVFDVNGRDISDFYQLSIYDEINATNQVQFDYDVFQNEVLVELSSLDNIKLDELCVQVEKELYNKEYTFNTAVDKIYEVLLDVKGAETEKKYTFVITLNNGLGFHEDTFETINNDYEVVSSDQLEITVDKSIESKSLNGIIEVIKVESSINGEAQITYQVFEG